MGKSISALLSVLSASTIQSRKHIMNMRHRYLLVVRCDVVLSVEPPGTCLVSNTSQARSFCLCVRWSRQKTITYKSHAAPPLQRGSKDPEQETKLNQTVS